MSTPEQTISEEIQRRAQEDPAAPALRWRGHTLTRGELNERATRAARHMQRIGVTRGERVGVLLDRGPDLIIAILATLTAGAAYVPLDPTHPPRRLETIASTAGISKVLTCMERLPLTPTCALPIVLNEPLMQNLIAALPSAPLPSVTGSDDLAYVLHTSGSTGVPKGVMIPHRCVTNLISHARATYSMNNHDRVLQFAKPTFDVSVSDIFCSLACGACLVLASQQELTDPAMLGTILREESVTVADIPPAFLPMLDPCRLPKLRLLFVGGETLTATEGARWLAPGRRVFHRYGPTETTVCCTEHLVIDTSQDLPIGGPITGVHVAILDDAHNDAQLEGQLAVGGAGVGWGYLAQPGHTASVFVPDPSGPPGSRRYLTGDRVQVTDRGLRFQERIDEQLNLHGQRIEPGEIEAALVTINGIRAAAVVVETNVSVPRLAAFLTGDAIPPDSAIRRQLGQTLPANRLPTRFYHLEELPLTGNGKVDRASLSGRNP